jgi:predicted  nucleic acid-binding Zn-ribbon protein
MTRKLLLLGVLMALCLIPALAMEFDINNAKYRRGTEFWTVDIPITGF